MFLQDKKDTGHEKLFDASRNRDKRPLNNILYVSVGHLVSHNEQLIVDIATIVVPVVFRWM